MSIVDMIVGAGAFAGGQLVAMMVTGRRFSAAPSQGPLATTLQTLRHQQLELELRVKTSEWLLDLTSRAVAAEDPVLLASLGKVLAERRDTSGRSPRSGSPSPASPDNTARQFVSRPSGEIQHATGGESIA